MLVRLENVSKRFPNGVQALDRINLSFAPGEVTVVLGPSGAGKSTLLRLINGLEQPTEGVVRVGDCVVQPRAHRQVRRQVGMIFQQFNLVPRLTVMANVLCGRLAYRSWLSSLFFTFPASDFALAERALAEVGLEGRQWDRVDKLSGGQQQRVAIARTIVQQAKFVLADEPVASLDPATSEEVLQTLVDAARQHHAGLILNLHQVDLARRYAQRIVGMRKGVVLFDIAPQQLDDERVRSLYASA